MEQAMPETLDEALAVLPRERQDAIDRRAEDLIRRISLRELRKSLGISQKQLAGALRVSQAAVSKQERRQGIQVGTLCEVVEAMGGTVEITAYFPGDRTVRLMPGSPPLVRTQTLCSKRTVLIRYNVYQI
jgi:DNA-binding transcriptional regulator YiaG